MISALKVLMKISRYCLSIACQLCNNPRRFLDSCELSVRILLYPLQLIQDEDEGVWWRSGRVSDSESRGPGFDPHSWHPVVLEQDTLTHYWLNPGSIGSFPT